MKATANLIECTKGVQVEMQLPRNWTVYSRVYRDDAAARKAAHVMATQLYLDLAWTEDEAAKKRGE